MRALLLLAVLCFPCAAEDPWAPFTPSTVHRGNLAAAVRDWYRFAWQGVTHAISADANWEAARVSGDLVLRRAGSQDALLVRDDGLIEERPLSAEEIPTAADTADLARCAWAVAILAMRQADPPLLPTSIQVETSSSGEIWLRWETTRNRGPFLRFAPDSPAPSHGRWGRGSRRCVSTGCSRTPSGSG